MYASLLNREKVAQKSPYACFWNRDISICDILSQKSKEFKVVGRCTHAR
jgi:hypothetical protein